MPQPCAACEEDMCGKCAGPSQRRGKELFCEKCTQHPCPKCSGPVKSAESIECGPEDDRAQKKGCGRAFHLKCVGLALVPKGDW